MPAREVAHLRFPIGVVGRIFVQEDNGRSAAGLFEIEADFVLRDGVGHLKFLWSAMTFLRIVIALYLFV
jgi:hypothetical protein